MLVAAAHMDADANAAVFGNGAVEVVSMVENVCCVVGAEAVKSFVTSAQETENLVLSLHIHLCRVLPFFIEGVPERGSYCST